MTTAPHEFGPQVIAADVEAIPLRWQGHDVHPVFDMAVTYPVALCRRCIKPVGDHLWFVLNIYTEIVIDCSEKPL